MDWAAFIDYFATKSNFPIIAPLLKQSRLISTTETECTISCENLGMKLYLDSKRSIIESVLMDYAKKDYTLSFVVEPKKKSATKKKQEKQEAEPITLQQFQGDVEEKIRKSGLQARYTFENFAVSNTNQMAFAAAQAVARSPGVMYNPLFIYGSVGVGKTHISQAVANEIVSQDPQKKILYCTSEEFTNDLVKAIQKKNTNEIRDKYRQLDVLVVDDTQFIAGKNYVQEEFYHTFNTLVRNGSQIVLVSDRPPQEIKALEDRLRSRFTGGLIIDMQKPDFELRTAIILIKAKERNIEIDMTAAQNIAEKVTDSRELEGALLKLLSISLLQSDSNIISAATASHELARVSDEKSKRIKPQDIINTVAMYYDLKPSQIKGSSRKQNIALARQVAMYLMRKRLNLNLEEVAFLIKRKDHTTVLHGSNKIESMMFHNQEFKQEVERIYDSALSS